MAKPMMIQQADDEKIEKLKKRLGSKSKVEVVRRALELLELEVNRAERVKRWQRATSLVGSSGMDVMREFQNPKRFDSLEK